MYCDRMSGYLVFFDAECTECVSEVTSVVPTQTVGASPRKRSGAHAR